MSGNSAMPTAASSGAPSRFPPRLGRRRQDSLRCPGRHRRPGRRGGHSRVVELHDPTAHAEVMALRAAGEALGTHLFETGVMYCSSEPCPMCLAACYWARLPRLVFAATSYDVATSGFEDLQLYRELTLQRDQRALREDTADGDLRGEAASALRAWADKLPFPVEPKY